MAGVHGTGAGEHRNCGAATNDGSVIAMAIHKTIGLRVSEDAEAEGLDLAEHQETAYSFSGRI